IRDFGGSWSLAVQTAFLVGAAALLVSILASGSFRARAKLLIARHLFAAKYDYRQEWLRFIATLAEDEESDRLPLRVVKAIAQIVESRGAACGCWTTTASALPVPKAGMTSPPLVSSRPPTASP